MKIALVYDHINKMGGAERILISLHELFPEAPLYTLVADTNKANWAKRFQIKTSFLQNIPWAKSSHEFFPVIPIFAFEKFNFDGYDIVLSITSAEAKGVITGPKILHICYCLTPTRYLWSHYYDYFSNKIVRFFAAPLISIIRIWDQTAAQRPDNFLAISQTVAKRTKKYYRRKADIIYPPVDITKFIPATTKTTDNYFLIVSRLVKYKHIEIAIDACNRLELPLIIIGEGLEKNKLKNRAGKFIKFMGNLTDKELIRYYQNCRALLFPQEEDFGITALEAMACGKPVIAYKDGGALETIIEGETGEFFHPQTADALYDVLKIFNTEKYQVNKCRTQAEKFSSGIFKKQINKFIVQKWEEYKNL